MKGVVSEYRVKRALWEYLAPWALEVKLGEMVKLGQ